MSNTISAVQACGIIFEALRLVMVQRLLSSPELKMDPMVSLYYYAPACAVINGALMAVVEVPNMKLSDFANVGIPLFLCNGVVAFLLNVSTVLLVRPPTTANLCVQRAL